MSGTGCREDLVLVVSDLFSRTHGAMWEHQLDKGYEIPWIGMPLKERDVTSVIG